MKKISILIVVIIVVLGFACKKDENPPRDSSLLKKIVSRQGDSVGYLFFSYDVHNRLTMVVDSNNNGHRYSTTIIYDSSDRLIKYNFSDGRDLYSATFTYSKGRVVRKNIEPILQPNNNQAYHSYGYDAVGKLTSDSTILGRTGKLIHHQTYQYDQNDNVTSWQIFYYDFFTGNLTGNSVTNLQHDNQLNPFSEIGLNLYFVRGDNYLGNSSLSKNNRVRTQDNNNNVVEYTYEYYNDGRLKKMILNAGGSSLPSISEFFY